MVSGPRQKVSYGRMETKRSTDIDKSLDGRVSAGFDSQEGSGLLCVANCPCLLKVDQIWSRPGLSPSPEQTQSRRGSPREGRAGTFVGVPLEQCCGKLAPHEFHRQPPAPDSFTLKGSTPHTRLLNPRTMSRTLGQLNISTPPRDRLSSTSSWCTVHSPPSRPWPTKTSAGYLSQEKVCRTPWGELILSAPFRADD